MENKFQNEVTYNLPQLPVKDTLEEAKKKLRAGWKKGVVCSCCNQFVKLYPRKLTSAMAYALVLIYQHHQDETFGAFFHVENYLKLLPDIPASIRGDFPKLRYWGLIEQKQELQTNTRKKPKVVPGYYRITPLGIQFVKNMISVPRISLLYNNQFWGHEGPEVTIKDAMKDKFDYEELMCGK